MKLKLSDHDDSEKEYERVCSELNRISQLHEHTAAKNVNLRSIIEQQKERIKELEAALSKHYTLQPEDVISGDIGSFL